MKDYAQGKVLPEFTGGILLLVADLAVHALGVA